MHASVLLAALCGTAVSAAVSVIEAVGSKFYNKDGSQFFIKGMEIQHLSLAATVDGGTDLAYRSRVSIGPRFVQPPKLHPKVNFV
jgi:hypothetical protein